MKLIALLLVSVTSVLGIEPEAVPNGLGVNIHFTQEQPGELDMIRAAGFTLVRMDLFWHDIEKPRGAYDFSSYDNLVDGIEKRGMKIILIVDYTHRLYDNDQSVHTDEGRAAYAAFAAEAAKHFKGKPVIFEIYNEPNITPFWRPTPDADNYAKMALVACKAIRATDENAVIIGPALAGATELDFLETCFKAGLLEYFSAVSVHPYRQTAPETVAEDYRRIRALIRKYAPKDKVIPILSGEWGFSDTWASFDRDKQATYLARQFLTNLANDIPISIYYDWRDDGLDPKEPEHHFGLVEHTPTGDPKQPFKPKPAYLAAKTVMEQLKGLKFNKQLFIDDSNVHFLLFGSGTEACLVAWTLGDSGKPVRLPVDRGGFRKVQLSGTTEEIHFASAVPEVVLNDSPTFFQPSEINPLLITLANWKSLAVTSDPQAVMGKRMYLTEDFRNESSLTLTSGMYLIPSGMPGRMMIEPSASAFDGLARLRSPLKLDKHLLVWQEVMACMERKTDVSCAPISPDKLLVQFTSTFPPPIMISGSVKESASSHNIALTSKEPARVVALDGKGEKADELNILLNATPTRTESGFTVTGRWQRKFRFCMLPYDAKYSAVAEGAEASQATAELTSGTPPQALYGIAGEVPELSYRFSTGWKYICVKPLEAPVKIDGLPSKLGIWIHGDKSKNLLRMRFIDSTGQTFQPDGGRLNFEGWKYIEFPMDGSSGGFWGGAKDGKIHYPIKLETLLLIDNASRVANEGKVYFAAPCLYYDVK